MSIPGRRIAGSICIVLGIAGLALPLLPGIPLLLIGLKLLGADHTVKDWLKRFKKTST